MYKNNATFIKITIIIFGLFLYSIYYIVETCCATDEPPAH